MGFIAQNDALKAKFSSSGNTYPNFYFVLALVLIKKVASERIRFLHGEESTLHVLKVAILSMWCLVSIRALTPW
jgi:hypothetical protein